jgi:hypothetical protein
MKTAGYHGTPDFTYQDALTFASETEAGYMMVCQNTLNQSDSSCKNNDPWTKAGPLTTKEAIGILAIPVIVLGIGVLAECGPVMTVCANAAGWASRAIGSAILGGLGGEGGEIPGAAPAATETGTSAAARALARLPKAARESEKPPGFNPETWQWREGSRTNVPRSWWDPEGGEWRFHPADKYHDPHWDYNPWQQWNTPWQHLYPGD